MSVFSQFVLNRIRLGFIQVLWQGASARIEDLSIKLNTRIRKIRNEKKYKKIHITLIYVFWYIWCYDIDVFGNLAF